MLRLKTIAVSAAALLGLAACGEEITLAKGPPLEDCRAIDLVDARSGTALTGIEDIALDTETGTAYLSAYDRFALEDALAAIGNGEAAALPRGGLYALDLETALQSTDTLALTDLTASQVGPGDYRTHGIGLYEGPLGDTLIAAVTHRYSHADAGGTSDLRRVSGIDVFAVTGDSLTLKTSLTHPSLCQANDVAIVGPRKLLVTRDRGSCDGWMWVEDVLGLKRASVMRVDLNAAGALETPPVPVAGGIGFANGIAIDRTKRRAVVAATRESALLVFDLERLLSGHSGRPVGRIALGGGPDNLAMAPDGSLLAAVHPSLMTMGFYRKRWFDTQTAPARLMTVDMADASRSILYDHAPTPPQAQDSGGAEDIRDRFSAVTVGVRYDDHVIMGTVASPGLLACALTPSETDR